MREPPKMTRAEREAALADALAIAVNSVRWFEELDDGFDIDDPHARAIADKVERLARMVLALDAVEGDLRALVKELLRPALQLIETMYPVQP